MHCVSIEECSHHQQTHRFHIAVSIAMVILLSSIVQNVLPCSAAVAMTGNTVGMNVNQSMENSQSCEPYVVCISTPLIISISQRLSPCVSFARRKIHRHQNLPITLSTILKKLFQSCGHLWKRS